MNPTENERLYGAPGAESLYFELSTAYEHAESDFADDEPKPDVVIEEWTIGPVRPPAAADTVIEWLVERACDDDMCDEGLCESWEIAGSQSEVVAAFQAALDLFASKTTYRMADTLVATHAITHDADGNPMLDGEPLYRPVKP